MCAPSLPAAARTPIAEAAHSKGAILIAVVSLQIEGVWVRPGDWLYADEDGVVVTAAPT